MYFVVICVSYVTGHKSQSKTTCDLNLNDKYVAVLRMLLRLPHVDAVPPVHARRRPPSHAPPAAVAPAPEAEAGNRSRRRPVARLPLQYKMCQERQELQHCRQRRVWQPTLASLYMKTCAMFIRGIWQSIRQNVYISLQVIGSHIMVYVMMKLNDGMTL